MDTIISYGRFPCSELAPHKNKGMELTYVESGSMEWLVEGVLEKVKPQSIFFTLPWQVHGSLHPTEPDNTIWHLLFHLNADHAIPQAHFDFPAVFGFTPTEMHTLSSVFCASNQHCFCATVLMRELMPMLIKELQSTHALRDAHVITLLRAILIELKRIITGESVDTAHYTPAERKVQTLITTLSAACDREWTLKAMADQCNIQRTQLGKIFQKLTNCTPMEYLSRLRLERARTLLRETDLSITEIAFTCGFNSSQYFAKIFKHATHFTPSEYRINCTHLSASELRKWQQIGFRSEKEERARVVAFSQR